jgi:hypothetical protein
LDDRLTRRFGEGSCFVGGARNLPLLHNPFTFGCKPFDAITEHFSADLCPCKEGRKELAYRGFREDQADAGQDPNPRGERANARK